LRKEHRLRVVENRVMRIFGTWREQVKGERMKQQNKGLKDLYCSPGIVHVIKSRKMR